MRSRSSLGHHDANDEVVRKSRTRERMRASTRCMGKWDKSHKVLLREFEVNQGFHRATHVKSHVVEGLKVGGVSRKSHCEGRYGWGESPIASQTSAFALQPFLEGGGID